MFSFLIHLESGAGDATTSTATATPGSPAKNQPSAIGDGTQVVFPSELMPAETLVKLQSKAANDSKQRPLFVVHAIEGFVTALKPLAGKMTCPVYGLQCTVDAPLSSISDLAAFYVKKIKTVQPKGPYAIAGYSFGASVAFEMVLLLEKTGESATLVMFDGSPKYVSWYTETHKQRLEGGSTTAQDESYGLAYFGMVCANVNYVTTAKELESLPTFDSRLKRLAEIVAGASKYSPDLVSFFFVVVYGLSSN